MNISYAILTHNEDTSLEKLLNILLKYKTKEDEIIIVDDYSDNQKTQNILQWARQNKVIVYAKHIERTIHDQKNFLIQEIAEKDYCFFIDADEYINLELIKNIHNLCNLNPENEVFFFPRINILTGSKEVKEEYIKLRGWKCNEKGWVNWPDIQDRLFKRNKKIYYNPIPHGRLIGYKKFSILPYEEEWAIIHKKSIDKQINDNKWHDNKEHELGLR